VKHRAALALVALTLAPTIPLQAQGESLTPNARVPRFDFGWSGGLVSGPCPTATGRTGTRRVICPG
jgi:hypothetical protein